LVGTVAVAEDTPSPVVLGPAPFLDHLLEIIAASLAGLLLDVAYSCIDSDKFFSYRAYIVIGLALLGIGMGGVMIVSRRLRNESTDNRVLGHLLLGVAAATPSFVSFVPTIH
jgi:hypothetical protein